MTDVRFGANRAATDAQPAASSNWGFFQRAVILAGVVSFGLIVWQLSDVLLLLFGAILIAVLLRAIAEPLARHTRLSDAVATALTSLFVVAAVFLVFVFFGAQISGQFGEIAQRLPEAIATVEQRFNLQNLSQRVMERAGSATGTIISNLTDKTDIPGED
jgi:predicted PurR-regulated permease PerM